MSLDTKMFFELRYKATKNGNIKIFHKDFVDRNKDKCKILYKGKEHEISEYFYFDVNNCEIPKIQLIINNYIADLSSMFYKCEELLSFKDISKLDDYNIIYINQLFSKNNYNNSNDNYNYSNEFEKSDSIYDDSLALSSISLKSDTSDFIGKNSIINKENTFQKKIFYNVTNMSQIFRGCSSLMSLPDMSKWDTKNVSNMSHLFDECSSLIILPDLSKWDIKNVTNIHSMFERCFSLLSLPDISKWDTKNVTNMSNLFHGCTSLISLPDISK